MGGRKTEDTQSLEDTVIVESFEETVFGEFWTRNSLDSCIGQTSGVILDLQHSGYSDLEAILRTIHAHQIFNNNHNSRTLDSQSTCC